jgi:sterol desaturase/sphingolipid hydroxylase (fatty acid hydroxylase superfamily)
MLQLPAGLALEVIRLTAWLALLVAIFVPLERAFGLRKKQRSLRQAFRTDLTFYYLNSVVPKLVLVMPLSLIAGFVHYHMPAGIYSWVASFPSWFRLLAALMVGEVGSYWGHRWSHEIPWLWRFHAIHHSAEEIDWLVNTRAHPMDMIFTRLCGLIPMYVLGLAQPMANTVDLVPVLVTIAGTIWGFFVHANVNWRFGWLEWIVASPAFHHWHHTNDGPERIDKNFAAMLPLVDRFFGTFYLPAGEWPSKYGTDTAVTSDLGGQLLQPFLSQDHRSAQWRPSATAEGTVTEGDAKNAGSFG